MNNKVKYSVTFRLNSKRLKYYENQLEKIQLTEIKY
jgi:hypothetical protein